MFCYFFFSLKRFAHTEKYFCGIRSSSEKKEKWKRWGKESDSHQQCKSVPVPVSGMVHFFCHYLFYSKNGLFKFPNILYTHEYYKILTGDIEGRPFTYTFQLFFTKLDPL